MGPHMPVKGAPPGLDRGSELGPGTYLQLALAVGEAIQGRQFTLLLGPIQKVYGGRRENVQGRVH